MSQSKQPETQLSFAAMFKELELGGFYSVEQAKIDIAEHISLAMRQRHVSKAELARRLNKSRAYVTKVLRSGANFTIESLVKIADALDCAVDVRFVTRGSTAESGGYRWENDCPMREHECTFDTLHPEDALAA